MRRASMPLSTSPINSFTVFASTTRLNAVVSGSAAVNSANFHFHHAFAASRLPSFVQRCSGSPRSEHLTLWRTPSCIFVQR